MKKWVILMFLFFGTLTAYNQIIKSVEYVIDSNRILPLDSVLYGNQKSAFQNIKPQGLNFGFLDAAVWLKIKVDEDVALNESVFLELKNPNLDLIKVSIVVGREIYHLDPIGDQFIFSKRKNFHRYFDFELPFKLNEITNVYVYIDNFGDQLFIPINIISKSEIESRDYILQYQNGIYFGILLFVFLLNLFLYFSLKEKTNFYYLFYILGLFFLQLSLEGYGFEFVWPKSVYLTNHANPLFATFSVFFLLHFCKEFLSLKNNLPRINRIFNYTGIFLLIILILAIPNIKWAYKFSILSINSIALLLNVFIIPIGIYLWIKGYKAARFFVVAFVALVLGVFFFILRNFGLIPNNMIIEKSLQIGSSFEVILLTLAIVDKFRIFKDQAYHRLQEINELKSQANVELEIKVNQRTLELKEQKELVEWKNKEITESIEYAKRIQRGLLPSDKLYKEMYPQSFVLYLPKDIVSGDFYWIEQVGDKKYFAAVDCTGHGVPGAMVSVLGFNHLNRCLNDQNIAHPGEILDHLTKLMMASFRQSELTIYDGMDMSLCCYNKKLGELEYAGANNPLYKISNGILTEYKGTKQAIGYNENAEKFVNNKIDVKKGDWIYLFTDGFADQFGGPKNKKFKYKEFKELLVSVNSLSPNEQCEHIKNAFFEWKKDNDQLDDVCVLGIQI